MPDPNNDVDENAIRYWLSLCDYYEFPHVILFESVEQLVELLHHLNAEAVEIPNYSTLRFISRKMMVFNRKRLKRLLRYWRARLLEIARVTPIFPRPS